MLVACCRRMIMVCARVQFSRISLRYASATSIPVAIEGRTGQGRAGLLTENLGVEARSAAK